MAKNLDAISPVLNKEVRHTSPAVVEGDDERDSYPAVSESVNGLPPR